MDVIGNLSFSHHLGKDFSLCNFLSNSKTTKKPKASTKLCMNGITIDKSASKTGVTLNQSNNTLCLSSDETDGYYSLWGSN